MSLPYSPLCLHMFLCSHMMTIARVMVRIVDIMTKWATRKKIMVEMTDMVIVG